jgi:integrase
VANFNFTEARLAALQPPATGEQTNADTAVPGLCIRVRANGSKAYFVRYRLGGRGSQQRRYTIGTPDDVRLDDARKAAARIIADVLHGFDPVGERRAKAACAAEEERKTTIAELVEVHEAEQRSRGIVSAGDAAAMLRRDFTACIGQARDPSTVTRAEIVRCIDRVRDGVPGHAAPRRGSVSTFRARLHGLFETALARGLVTANPLSGYRQPRRSRAQHIELAERRAGRMLSMEEIAALWAACGDLRVSQSFGAYARGLVLTGCRRTELAAARLAWVRPKTADRPALLVIPAAVTKTGRQHILPLPALATAVIAGVRRYADTDLIFPGGRSHSTGKTARISGWSKSWPRLLDVAREYGLRGAVRIHDLRKSARSHWGRLGVHDRVAESLLNHAEPNALIATYDRRDLLAEKVQAMELWCSQIEVALSAREKAASGLQPTAAVVSFRPPSKGRRRPPAATGGGLG